MSDLRKEIIEAGYKALMIKNHPDQGPAGDKPQREETCQRLAVARDWLIYVAYGSNATSEQRAAQPHQTREPHTRVVQQPIITTVVDHVFNNLADLFFGKRPPRPRRRVNPTRPPRRDS